VTFQWWKGPDRDPIRHRRSIDVADEIIEAAAPVLRDARAAGHHVEVATWADETAAAWVEAVYDGEVRAFVTVGDDGGATGLTLHVTHSLAARVAVVAEVVQDSIVEMRGEPFPACPAHPNHPMWVWFEDGMAWPEWRCPAGGAAIRVGEVAGAIP
jgi:hypothetical protein